MNLIHIRDVYVQEGWHGWTKAIAVADHDQRISDPHLRRAIVVEISLTIEDVFYKSTISLGVGVIIRVCHPSG